MAESTPTPEQESMIESLEAAGFAVLDGDAWDYVRTAVGGFHALQVRVARLQTQVEMLQIQLETAASHLERRAVENWWLAEGCRDKERFASL